ncbi:hypothetical protein AKJ16_DCAP11961 [Drosera capensis]
MEKSHGELEEAKADSSDETAKQEEQLGNIHEKLHLEYQDKLSEFEAENKRLHLSLDVASEKNKSQEQKILLLEKEIESLKEANRGGFLLAMLEEEKRNVDEQLKWKTEQFDHLEEAHKKLRNKFRACESEWGEEKALLLEEISTLQSGLDSKNEASVQLKIQVEMCKQALSREENRRKKLEAEVSEMKLRLEDVTADYEEAKYRIECSIAERNDGSSALRNSLRIKETLCKELEYNAKKLEEENKELLQSLKELQESQIPKVSTPPTSLVKLRCKLKNLEQTHRECSLNQRAKEAEWRSQWEIMARELNDRASSRKMRDTEIAKLKEELEGCRFAMTELKLQNEELSLMAQLLKSESSDSSQIDSQSEDEAVSIDQLESMDDTLVKAQGDIEKECEKCTSLMIRTAALEGLEQQKLLMQEELESCKELLKQSVTEQLIMKEEAAEIERNLSEELQEVSRALEMANAELSEMMHEGCELELDLQVWKLKAELLEAQLEQKRVTRKYLESSLIAQSEFEMRLKQHMDCLTNELEERDSMIAELQLQITSSEKRIKPSAEEIYDGEELYPLRENVDTPLATSLKTSKAILNDRSVLRECN